MQINDSNTSLTAAVDGASANAGYTTIAGCVWVRNAKCFSLYYSFRFKESFWWYRGNGRKSFFGVGVSAALISVVAVFGDFVRNGEGYTAGNNLDTISSACTIEAVIRPMQSNSIIYFRRLATSQDTLTRNKFMKMELTKSADNREDAFRFYIRDADSQQDFTEDFSQENVQASGLFVPADVGIDLFDGDFHHLVVSWDMNEMVDTRK